MSKNEIKKLGHSFIMELITLGIPALFRLIKRRGAARKAKSNK
jgi:hypothetical protein